MRSCAERPLDGANGYDGMTAYFPYNLPPVPATGPNPWTFEPPAGHQWDEVQVDDRSYTRTRNLVDAANAEEAEQRVLSYLYARCHQDLDGAYATAIEQPVGTGRWEVHVYQPVGV